MTDQLESMIEGLGSAVLTAAQEAPVAVRQIEAVLPIEFGLRHGAEGFSIAARPPEQIQARVLSTPVGRFAFTLTIAQGGHDV